MDKIWPSQEFQNMEKLLENSSLELARGKILSQTCMDHLEAKLRQLLKSQATYPRTLGLLAVLLELQSEQEWR